MIGARIDLPNVLKRMTKLRGEFDEIIEELEMLSNPRTRKHTLPELKKAIGLQA